MKVWLAPMEGLMDYFLREIVTSLGGFDISVSEFIRVVDRPLPESVFLTQVPELHKSGHTKAGTPVRVQLLGSDPQALAENAQTALALGSHGIDYNFGCPSNTVNRRSGGAALLQYPNQIYDILSCARRSLPGKSKISAKMRLGFENSSLSLEIAQAIEDAGVNEIIIHGRTKLDGYKPPADWEAISQIQQQAKINIIANGDIFSFEDSIRCRDITGCKDLMIGRGAIYQPDLALAIKLNNTPIEWRQITDLIIQYSYLMQRAQVKERHLIGRIKQWIKLLGFKHEEARELLTLIKKLKSLDSILNIIQK